MSSDGGSTVEPVEVVRAYWERMQERDWAGVLAVLDPAVVVEWPASGERFAGAEAVVGVNRDYPEGWSIEVVRVVPGPDGVVVSEVEVPQEGVGVFAAASFFQVRSGRIVYGREYWVGCAAEEPPPWRKAYAKRYDGRLSPPP
jgi:ketosteroid isomerase-like protein